MLSETSEWERRVQYPGARIKQQCSGSCTVRSGRSKREGAGGPGPVP